MDKGVPCNVRIPFSTSQQVPFHCEVEKSSCQTIQFIKWYSSNHSEEEGRQLNQRGRTNNNLCPFSPVVMYPCVPTPLSHLFWLVVHSLRSRARDTNQRARRKGALHPSFANQSIEQISLGYCVSRRSGGGRNQSFNTLKCKSKFVLLNYYRNFHCHVHFQLPERKNRPTTNCQFPASLNRFRERVETRNGKRQSPQTQGTT